MIKSKQKITRYFLGTLLAFVALNAFGGGYYGLSGAKDIPLEWLEGSPFSNYFIPSLFLLIVVGGSCLYAAATVFRNGSHTFVVSLLCGLLLIFWIIVQVFIIGYVSWMQPAVFIAGIVTLVLAFQIRRS